MTDSDSKTTPDWIRLSPELEHFDPFAGLVDFTESESKHIRYGFKICNMSLLFDEAMPCELKTNYSVFPIPNTPAWIRGLINHRGNLIPVFDLYSFWSLQRSEHQLPLLIFDEHENFIAIHADAYPIALETTNATINSTEHSDTLPAEIIQFKKISYSIDNTVWHEIDLRGFMQYITRNFSDSSTNNQNI